MRPEIKAYVGNGTLGCKSMRGRRRPELPSTVDVPYEVTMPILHADEQEEEEEEEAYNLVC